MIFVFTVSISILCENYSKLRSVTKKFLFVSYKVTCSDDTLLTFCYNSVTSPHVINVLIGQFMSRGNLPQRGYIRRSSFSVSSLAKIDFWNKAKFWPNTVLNEIKVLSLCFFVGYYTPFSRESLSFYSLRPEHFWTSDIFAFLSFP